MHDLALADACARAAIERLDAPEADPRSVALRATLEELRGRLARSARIRSLRIRCVAAVAALAVPVLPTSRQGRAHVRSRQPEAPGGLKDLADEVAGILQGLGILAGRRARVRVAHAEVAAARVWSLVHGGPLFPVGESEPGPWQPRASRQEAKRLREAAERLHTLIHLTCDEAAAADDPDEIIHRLARLDAAHRGLGVAAELLRGRLPGWARAMVLAILPVYVGLAAALAPYMLGMVFGLLVVSAGQRVRQQACPNPNFTWSVAAEHAGVLTEVERVLAAVSRLPAARATAELAAARELLRSTGGT
ncbi:hypothetical protein AB0I28_29060 [Phytomonospora sp. NPDC050363]|uniref:hypothetical protein n=1 Tax=Phytomonospora sp. NPDC050363 TaxID=3155642 RepID=UPI0033F59874